MMEFTIAGHIFPSIHPSLRKSNLIVNKSNLIVNKVEEHAQLLAPNSISTGNLQ
jgi:hypothetical protein